MRQAPCGELASLLAANLAASVRSARSAGRPGAGRPCYSPPVRVLILTGKRDAFSVKRLEAEFRSASHEVLVLDPFDCCVSFDHEGTKVLHGERALAADVVVPRFSARNATPYCTALVRALEMQGAFALNRADAIELARDKLRALQVLAARGVPVPRTLLLAKKKQIELTLPDLGGPPVIVKIPSGTQGVGVMLAESHEALWTLLDTLWRMRQDSLVQRFVREAGGRDIRALVVGGRVVAAMRRTARSGEFRANVHRGGAAEVYDMDARSNELARRAADAVGLAVAGVDLLEANEGTLVLEVNSSPIR
jgi:ribosomal protein S6--L-glutamate ligase